MPRRHRAVVLTSLSALALSAFPSATTAVEADPVVFRIGATQAARPVELNPFRTTSGMGYGLIADRYDLLVGFGEDLSPAPGLAERWDISEDGLTWTYHIRQGATWQDGQPVSADDVAFTLNYIIDSHRPDYVGASAPEGNDTDGDGEADNPLSLFDSYLDLDAGVEEMRISSVEATDPNTVVITTSAPIATLGQMFIPMLPRHIWQDITFAGASGPIELDQAIGSGPFQIVEFEPRQLFRLVAHEGYWGGTPHIDELIYQVFENDEAQIAALREGSVDFLDNFPPTLIGALEADPNITVNRGPSTDFAELGFNSWDPTPERFEAEGCADCPRGPTTGSMGDPWLTRPEFRAALAGLLDKQHLIDFALSGAGTPGVSIVSPLSETFHYSPPPGDLVVFPGYSDEAGRATARAAAEQRFTDAMAALGFKDTDGNGILNVPNDAEAQAFDPLGAGLDWSLRLHVRASDEEDKLAGELMEGWYEAAGVDIDRLEVSEEVFYEITYPSASNADMDMYIWGWGPDPDPDFILSIFACNQINNWQDANYCDPDYDSLYRESRGATDPAERAEIVKQLQDKVFHDSPYAVLWYVDILEAYRSDRWEGFNPMPRSGGALWATTGMGPWGSRTTVGPIGAAGPTPPPPSAEPSAEPSASPGPSASEDPGASGDPSATPEPTDAATPAPSAAPTTPAASATPGATAAPAPGGTGGGSGDMMPLLVGGGLAAAAAAVVGFLLLRRRRDEDDEE